ncbi:ankyrin repeat-containing domain protein [Annulohypoxylon moriforme]|nr:ankyrin repeat-containing domain protein [Annulohypoxylon moriforme]
MPPATKKRRLADPDWRPFKPYISRMINGRKEHKSAQILDFLRLKGLEANENQLESQLKKWNIWRKLHKSQSNASWQYIAYSIDQRRKKGKKSKVVIYSKIYDESEAYVIREIKRCRPSTSEEINQGSVGLNPPEGAMVWISSPLPLQPKSAGPMSLPWFEFIPPFSLLSTKTDLTHLTNGTFYFLLQCPTTEKGQDIRQNDYSSSAWMSQIAFMLGNFMPEAYEHENLSRAQEVVQGSPSQRLEQLVMIVLFLLSNDIFSNELINTWPTILELLQISGIMNQNLKLNRTKEDITMIAIFEKLYGIAFRAGLDRNSQHSTTIRSGTRSLIEWLLSFIQDPNGPVSIGDGVVATSLYAAVFYREVDLALALLRCGADPSLVARSSNVNDSYWDNTRLPLLEVIESDEYPRRLEIIKALLEKHAESDLLFTTKIGPRALHAAIRRKDLLTVELLVGTYKVNISKWYAAATMMIDRGDPEAPIRAFTCTRSVLSCAAGIAPESAALSMVEYLLDYILENNYSNQQPKVTLAEAIPAESLLIAAARGYETVVTSLLKTGVHIDTSNALGFTALHLAAFWGYPNICLMLLYQGASVDFVSIPGVVARPTTPSPLHLAAYADSLDIVRLLHDRGASISRGYTATPQDMFFCINNRYWSSPAREGTNDKEARHMISLFCASPVGAAMHNSKTGLTYKYLISKGATIPNFIVHHAANDLGDFELTRFLMEEAIQEEPGTDITLLKAFLTPNPIPNGEDDKMTKSLRLLELDTIGDGNDVQRSDLLRLWRFLCPIFGRLDNGVVPRLTSKMMIHAALLRRNAMIVHQICQEYPKAYDASALCLATIWECETSGAMLRVIQWLLNNRIPKKDAENEETLAIGIASWYKSMPLLELLLRSLPISKYVEVPIPPDCSRSDLSSLQPTTICKFKPIGLRPTDKKVNIRTVFFALESPQIGRLLRRHGYGSTEDLVDLAVEFKDLAIINEHLQHCKRPIGKNLLRLAIETRTFEIVEALLDTGVDVNDVEFYGSPLWAAMRKGDLRILKLLLERNADLQILANSCGNTAIEMACEKGYLPLVKLLLERMANTDALQPTKCNDVALRYAARNGRIDIIQLLLDSWTSKTENWRLYCTQAIAIAEQNGHRAAAHLLRLNLEWTTDDERLFSTRFDIKRVRQWEEKHGSWTPIHACSNATNEESAEEELDPDNDEQIVDMTSEDLSTMKPVE